MSVSAAARVLLRSCFALGMLLCVSGACCAQTADSPWAGEWGSFERVPSTDFPRFEGRGLSIYDCAGQGCQVSVLVQNRGGQGSAKGFVQVELATKAVAHLLSSKTERCSLALTLNPDESLIAAKGGGDCSDFETGSASLVQSYPLHTRDRYYDWNVPACFAATEPSKAAVCTSAALAKQESQWQMLFLSVTELDGGSGLAEMAQERTAEDNLLQGCDEAAQVADCMTAAFAGSTEQLNARKTAWLDGVTAPGDPGAASEAASAIEGSYRHSFPNSDVQGSQFLSTDRLEITGLPNNAIHYALSLQFFNGHECTLEGTAAYKRAGFFVDQKKTSQAQFPLCVFEIRPGENGVTFEDPTGACKMMSCGERGGYHGAHFSFQDRQ